MYALLVRVRARSCPLCVTVYCAAISWARAVRAVRACTANPISIYGS